MKTGSISGDTGLAGMSGGGSARSLFWLLVLVLGCSAPPSSSSSSNDDDLGDDDDGPDWGSSSLDPDSMAVYFGDPGAVTAADLAGRAIVILSENPDASYADHAEWAALASDLQAGGAEVFGWLDAGAPRAPSEIDAALDSYGGMGIDGVVLANVGLDVLGNNEARPIQFANNARDVGLKVILSATDPADVVHEFDPLGQALHAGDRVLLRGFGYGGGSYQDAAAWRAQVDVATAGAALWGATVVAATEGGDADAGAYAYWCAWLDGLEAVAWASADFSELPEFGFPGPANGGSAFTGEVSEGGGGAWSRTTDTGTITVDTNAHAGHFE